MPSVSFDAVTLAAPDGRVLHSDLTLGFGTERTGIVGANGAGKTTLLRVLRGELAPARGHVAREARLAYVEQRSGTPGETVAEVLGVAAVCGALARLDAGSSREVDADLAIVGDRWDVEARARAALERLGVGHFALDRPLSRASGGERTRVALAALLVEPSDVLVLDEPTHHLDRAGRAAVFALLDAYRGGVVVVSHDRELLERMDRILELSPLGVRVYGGGYSAYRDAREREAEAAAREWALANREVAAVKREMAADREKKARRESAGLRLREKGGVPKTVLGRMKETSEQSGARVVRAGQRRLDAATAAAGEARRALEVRSEITAEVAAVELAAARRVLWLDGVSVGRPPLFAPVTLAMHGGERLAIAGPNGSGKSTLLRGIAGLITPDAGAVVRGVSRVALVDQDTAFLRGEATVWESYRAHDPEGTMNALARFTIPHAMIERRISTLSGGERVRVALACVLGARRPAELIMLDEPTNHLDLASVEAIERALDGYDGALIVVSHDPAFLERVRVQRTVELSAA